MITRSQQKWLDHLRSDNEVVIKSYDSKSEVVFEEVKKKVIAVLGDRRVEHRGASYLKISGQEEIDVYVPVLPEEFDQTVKAMMKHFGEPRSLYPLIRARFPIEGFGKHVDVFVINEKHAGWIESEAFTNYLLAHPQVLDEYRKLKESGNGLNTKEYYKRKIEFMNAILAKAKQ